MSLSVVITTIQGPTASVRRLRERIAPIDGRMIVMGDKKGPASFDLTGARFVPLAEQLDLPFSIARLLPTGHYVRKNLGYLLAMKEGVSSFYETDDDNAPNAHWRPKTLGVKARAISHDGWVNVYRFFTDANIWPRGLPLTHARDPIAAGPHAEQERQSPIQQLLCDNAPDVDAAWRLTVGSEPFYFARGASIFLSPGAWCPFNSQATWWFKPAFPLLYLPSTCTFRMTDIWRSLVAQRCLWELGGGICFHSAEVDQERNVHNLARDFEDEVPGYLLNEKIARALGSTSLRPGAGAITDNLVRCYEALVAIHVFKPDELGLVRSWVRDIQKTGP